MPLATSHVRSRRWFPPARVIRACAAVLAAAACGGGTTTPTPVPTQFCYAKMTRIWPVGELPAGTRSGTMTLQTDRPAVCRWSKLEGVNYIEMENAFERTGGTEHLTPIDGLRDGAYYRWCAKCEATATGCANPHDMIFEFNVAAP